MSHDHDTVRTSCLPSPDIAGGTHAPGGPCVRRHHSLLRQSQRNLPNRPRRRAHARPRLAAHVCGITGSRRDELALRRQWHLGSSRDRGGRRQCHVGIAAGAASGMSESRRACAVSFTLRANDVGVPGVACLAAHVCGASRSQQDEHALFCPRVASDGRDRTPQPSVEGSVRSDGRHPRLPAAFGLRGQLPGPCAVSFAFRANDRRRRGLRALRPTRVRSVAIAAGRARAVPSARRDRTPQPSVEGWDGRHPRLPAAARPTACAEGREAARAGRRPRVGVDAYRLIPQQRAGSAVATRGRHSARARRSLVLLRSSAHMWAARHAS